MWALWWSCVVGLICTPAWVNANAVKVTQSPSTTLTINVNSSLSISCSISLTNVMGLYLKRRFYSREDIIFLYIKQGKISKMTKSSGKKFMGQVDAKLEAVKGADFGVTIILSQLQVSDSDLYFCSWEYFNIDTFKPETHTSNGTVVIIKEPIPVRVESCGDYILDIISITLSVIVIPFVMCLLFLLLYGMFSHFKRKFTPTVRPVHSMPRQRPQHMCQQPRFETYSYLNTSVRSSFSLER